MPFLLDYLLSICVLLYTRNSGGLTHASLLSLYCHDAYCCLCFDFQYAGCSGSENRCDGIRFGYRDVLLYHETWSQLLFWRRKARRETVLFSSGYRYRIRYHVPSWSRRRQKCRCQDRQRKWRDPGRISAPHRSFPFEWERTRPCQRSRRHHRLPLHGHHRRWYCHVRICQSALWLFRYIL